MRKFLAGLVSALVLSAAVVGALSVLPHAHGDDLDHSKHQTCPVYQFGLHDSSSEATATFVFGVLWIVAFLVVSFQIFRTPASRSFLLLRAPPVVS